jgi:hypothetical protein
MMTKEIWKSIKGYEGLYCVSNLGRVKSLPRKCKTKGGIFRSVTGKILKNSKNGSGYYYVCLSKNGEVHYKRVHILVAQAFIKNNDVFVKNSVNHIDGNKANNNLSNLEWVTPKENIDDAVSNGLFNNDVVIAIDDNNIVRYVFHSTREVSRALGIDYSSVSASMRGESSHAHVGGYRWVSGKNMCGRKLGDE